MEDVILVDKEDREIGQMEKLEAHQKGLLHKAFSVFIVNSKKEWLLQRRALSKYHSAGLWSNACCSHPRPGEPILSAAHRRLVEEMGFDTDLKEYFSFEYFAPNVGPNITENEIDHIFLGKYDGEVLPNKDEVMDYRWIDSKDLEVDIKNNPDKYSFWLQTIFQRTKDQIDSEFGL